MRLHLIRHAKPRIASGICYGQLDVESENPQEEASILQAQLTPDLPVWSSPLRRCHDLAKLLHPAPTIDVRLAEMNFGLWEGLSWNDVPRAELDAWAADVAAYAPPGGESALSVQQRALDFVRSLPVDEAVLVTHAGVIRTLVAYVMGLPPEEWCALEFQYGSHTFLELNR